MVDFVTTFIVPYTVLIILGISVFNAWMLIIIAKKFFIKTPTPNGTKNPRRESKEERHKAEPEEKAEKPKKKKKSDLSVADTGSEVFYA